MDRHPGTQHVARLLDPNPNLPAGAMADLAELAARFRDDVLDALPDDGPELTTGLRKLLEAKDCFVRHALVSGDD
jgi:hypothetical protein